MKKSLNIKIIFTLLSVLILLISFYSNCFASSEEATVLTVPDFSSYRKNIDGYDYVVEYIIYNNDSSYYSYELNFLYFSEDPHISLSKSGNSNSYTNFYKDMYKIPRGKKAWEHINDIQKIEGMRQQLSSLDNLKEYVYFNNIDYSNYEFRYNYILQNSSGDRLFPLPPTVLAPILEEAPLEEVIKEIVEILPIVLITIVGLISLKKGLNLLSTVLHNS